MMHFRVALTQKPNDPPMYLQDIYSYLQKNEDTLKQFLLDAANITASDFHFLQFRPGDCSIGIKFKAISGLYKNTRDILLCDSIVSAFWRLIQQEYDKFPLIECNPDPPDTVKYSIFSCCRRNATAQENHATQLQDVASKIIW